MGAPVPTSSPILSSVDRWMANYMHDPATVTGAICCGLQSVGRCGASGAALALSRLCIAGAKQTCQVKGMIVQTASAQSSIKHERCFMLQGTIVARHVFQQKEDSAVCLSQAVIGCDCAVVWVLHCKQ